MGNVTFLLKKPEPISGKSLIYLQFYYNGNKLVFSFGQSINPAHWNRKKQRVKSNAETTTDGKYSLNDFLDGLENACKRAYNEQLTDGIPEPATLKNDLVKFLNREVTGNKPTFYKLINRFTSGEIKHEGKDKSINTIKTYKVTLHYLQNFERDKRYKVTFDTINLDFYHSFVGYLISQGLNRNSIGKEVKNIKTFMNAAVDFGYTNNMQFKQKKFKVTRQDTDSIYLSENEIIDLYKFDLSGNSRLERVRDLFVFGCFVGLRFSDFSDLKPENIITSEGQKLISKITKKTGEQVFIPCNPVVLDIFKKYGNNANNLPNAPSNQKFNDYIKEVCQLAGMEEKARLITSPKKELWECISSHTARRSFATNYYLQGFPTIDLMKITGHKTEKAFLSYIRITKLDTAKRLGAHIKRNWSQSLLKAVG